MAQAEKSIHAHAARGDFEGVRSALAQGVPVDLRDQRDYTPLAYAAASSSAPLDVLSFLIEQGADINALLEKGKARPLGLAACAGNLKSLELLLDAGAPVNEADAKGYTALIRCVYSLHDSDSLLPIVTMLVHHGANVDCKSDYGERPITVASRLGRFDAVRALIDAGADATPLGWSEIAAAAAIGSDGDLARELAAHGPTSESDRYGRTPGMLAALVGSVSKGRLLASYGWNVRERGERNETALMSSVAANQAEMTDWLIANGAELDAVDESQNSALLLAAQAGAGACVRLLLAAGASTHLANEYGDTAMSTASNVDVVRQLQEAGETLSDVNKEMKRQLIGLVDVESIDCSRDEYEAGKRPQAGHANPQPMDIAFWRAMIRAGCCAYRAREQFGDTSSFAGAVWCFDRFGCSLTELPDGRFVQIGGEHEDHYDPDFCIYNDVVVHGAAGDFVIYGYPREVFRPTDFHSATYVDGSIYIVGSLGYPRERRFGATQVYRLSCDDWNMTEVVTRGENPGWIHKHRARLTDGQNLVTSGGTVATLQDGAEQHVDLVGVYVLCLATMTWSRR